MAYLAGIIIATLVSSFATLVGLDKERSFYPTVLVVIASYYGLFAVMTGSTLAVLSEAAVMVGFFGVTVLGFKRNLWFVVAALVTHGLFDFLHDHLIANPGVPHWWPMFCLAYDVVAACYLAYLLRRSRLIANAR
ncbi:hypothetical protein [Methylomonas rhizoryzae]|uniref:hypothetical protein n=1 Tax=Methylomonas rhizoryzae TaxID=2608981 RepID=UPI0012326B87|nr:hypothetical protein [Methylomonas rhizoryzae]